MAIDGVEWTLTEPTRAEAEGQARSAAVLDARERAQHYADALDLGAVAVRSVADEGLLGHDEPTEQLKFASIAADGAGASTDLVPQGIEVRAGVEARFEV